MKPIIMALKNIYTKTSHTVRVSREVWDALINVIEHIDNMDMQLGERSIDFERQEYYAVDLDGGDKFITSLANLEEVVWRNTEE